MAPYDEDISYYIGSIEHISLTPCDAHLHLLSLLLGSSIPNEPGSTIMVQKFRDPYIRLLADTGDDEDYDITSSAGFGIVRKGSNGYGRVLDPNWIDPNLMGHWKSDCSTLHGDKCRRLPNSSCLAPASPNWLVDVNRKCIVPARGGMSNVALSYVWGSSGNFRAVQSNVHQLQQPGALDSPAQELKIPRTIRDAMAVATHLHEQYLWVDALCIVQNDDATKQDQLNNMMSIYAEATVTIIAKDGIDSSHGLRGVPDSLPRDLHQNIFELANGREAIVHPWTLDKKPTPWASRGWTFQEDLFSPRKLIFEGQTIRWECIEATWHEDHDFNTIAECNDPDEDRILRASPLFEAQQPNIHLYGLLIGVYNKREFTYSAGPLNAFAGILSTLTRSFDGGFVSGLPVLFFDLALLWQPQDMITRRRRNADDKNDIVLPSWSWAGWKGEIDTRAWKRDLGSSEDFSARITVAVPMYLRDSTNGEVVLLNKSSYSSSATSMGSLLSCKTDKCFLKIGKQHSRGRNGVFFSLVDKKYTWAGSLRPHDYVPIQGGITGPSGFGEGSECELVSISQGYANNSEGINSNWIDEWKLSERPSSTERYRFHNVLWIMWENGIAYRRGLGRVMEDVWQQQELALIDLLLG